MRARNAALGWVVTLCVSALLGTSALLEDGGTQLSTWIWLSLWALPLGALAGSLLPRSLVPLPLISALIVAGALAADLRSPEVGLLALASLYVIGVALHGPRGAGAWSVAAALLFVGGLFSALPSAGGALVEPFPAALTARLLDLSPIVWVLESGGFDWMRHPSVYETAGAADIGPELRVGYSGFAGPLGLFVLGAMTVLVRWRWARRGSVNA